jgi:hypothetical protein
MLIPFERDSSRRFRAKARAPQGALEERPSDDGLSALRRKGDASPFLEFLAQKFAPLILDQPARHDYPHDLVRALPSGHSFHSIQINEFLVGSVYEVGWPPPFSYSI